MQKGGTDRRRDWQTDGVRCDDFSLAVHCFYHRKSLTSGSVGIASKLTRFSVVPASQRRPRGPRGAALPRASSLHKHHQTSLCCPCDRGAHADWTWPVSQDKRYQHCQTAPNKTQGFRDKIRSLIFKKDKAGLGTGASMIPKFYNRYPN